MIEEETSMRPDENPGNGEESREAEAPAVEEQSGGFGDDVAEGGGSQQAHRPSPSRTS